MKLFGESDCDKFGKIKSEYPVWYHEVHIEELAENVASAKRRLNRGEVPQSALASHKAELERNETRLGVIEKNMPKLSDGERDKLWELWKKELCPKIKESLFTRTEMMKGLASGHEEARRMVNPVIMVSAKLEKFLGFCNCQVVNHKASRNALAKAFKLTGRLLGESTNIEVLRGD